MISSWTDKKADAAKWIAYATSSKVMHTFVENQGQPARTSALTDPENVKIGRYFPTLQKVLAQGHPFPAIPESYQFLVEIGNHVAEILTKQTTPEAGLQAANDAFAKQLKMPAISDRATLPEAPAAVLSGPAGVRRSVRLRNAWQLYVLPPLILIALIAVVPTVQLLINSLYRWSLLSGMKRFDGLGQYVSVLTDTLFTGSLIRTLVYTLVVVAIEMVLGLAVALLFAREFPGIRLIRTLYLTPILMVPIMVGLLWSLMYQPSIGIVNYVLGLFGIEPLNWLASSSLALPAVAIAEIWQWTPFAAMVFVAGLQGLPANVIAAARLDGAGRLYRLLTIELPMMRNVVAIVFLLRFIDVFKTFGLIYVMTRGGPGRSTMMAGFYPWEVGFSQLLMGKASAAAFILMNLISLLTLLLLRFLFKERRLP